MFLVAYKSESSTELIIHCEPRDTVYFNKFIESPKSYRLQEHIDIPMTKMYLADSLVSTIYGYYKQDYIDRLHGSKYQKSKI